MREILKRKNIESKETKCVLSIAGSDSSGGAGIQADLKSIIANGAYGMTVITALTAQNTQGVTAIENVSLPFVEAQLQAVFDDIPPHAIKIGMLSTSALVSCVASFFEKNHELLEDTPIVLDPVMVATSGSRLLDEDAIDALTTKLFPQVDLLTPNAKEAEILCGFQIDTLDSAQKAAEQLCKTYKLAVLVKGGHLKGYTNQEVQIYSPSGASQVQYFNEPQSMDILAVYHDEGIETYYFSVPTVQNSNTHGTGCTLSSSIATYLAQGYNVQDAVYFAKNYVTACLKANMNLGKGSGPLDHACNLFKQAKAEALYQD